MNLVKSAFVNVLAVQLMTFPALVQAGVYQPAKTVTPSQVEEALQNAPVPGSDLLAEEEAESRMLANLPHFEGSSSDAGMILGITYACYVPPSALVPPASGQKCKHCPGC
jgi:hypothetical protein